jgi:hypothetical protein
VGGRIWLIGGVALGIAIAVVHLGYVAGAAATLSDTSQRIVGTAALTLVHSAARKGAARRAVEGMAALVRVIVPGLTALLLIVAARLSLRLRVLVGLLVLVFGVTGYHYLGAGIATGSLALALFAATIAVVATGPLVAAPLAALAALIGAEFLPKLVSGGVRSVPHIAVAEMHRCLFDRPGAPLWLGVVMLIVGAIPFALAARLVIRRP